MNKPQKVINDRRAYLLSRIPGRYDIDGFVAPKEPAEIRKARKRVESWDKKVSQLKCAHGKRNEALLRKARESVYFASEEKALAIIRQCEKMLTRCK